MSSHNQNLGKLIKEERLIRGLTLQQLSERSGVSSSHIGRIERGERFPSAHILRKIAQPLGFEQDELLLYAGYLSPRKEGEDSAKEIRGGLDPYVAKVLSEEPFPVQRLVIAILAILKTMAKTMEKEEITD